ncbi:BolA/IbaG family iron-sulfur metabolism protein [Idiomarina sp. FenBw--71]|uniref:BolA family transcriptional regulator n=1 Tax=Pseudidiomarina fusca TaxID=2965078 RepID=A0ABU3KY37_9GAMM|nr:MULTISPECIES: BolA family protein [Idiomarinaceae]MDT7525912.1 BolA family transcriptional regulator [Pseudidiomarina sp. GXY010]MRJ42004.1 BolA/IbaG family iron-sulfur metabolism protein [Idiomarina sp. FeN1]NCU57287.1 BolA/IbaG family iron-sulfur metabolism protein [Idiomarina sp. FenA--70]NCU59995.1 BolA/IbaG family iron-sulfur metabolism protein [Idiomarina sp. FenBw--71]UUN12907.1 BolA family transcriptional regulator [Idiomarina loihiensis]
MITTESIQTLITDALSVDEVLVKLDGGHANITVVGELFAELSRVKKQQVVYAPLKAIIASGELHAVSIKTYTPTEWQREKKLAMLS